MFYTSKITSGNFFSLFIYKSTGFRVSIQEIADNISNCILLDHDNYFIILPLKRGYKLYNSPIVTISDYLGKRKFILAINKKIIVPKKSCSNCQGKYYCLNKNYSCISWIKDLKTSLRFDRKKLERFLRTKKKFTEIPYNNLEPIFSF